MASKIQAKLAGEFIDKLDAISWPIRSGVDPAMQTFEVVNETWQRLRAKIGTAVDLEFNDPGGRRSFFSGLRILGNAAGSRPDTTGVVVADCRWLWRRKFIKRNFNIRRRSGARRRVGPEGIPIEVGQIADDIDFQTWSLDPGDGTLDSIARGRIRWTAYSALRNVMDELSENQALFSYRIPENFRQQLPFEGVELADPGPEAIARLLALIPGTDVFVSGDGVVIFYDKLDGRESPEIDKGMPAMMAGVHPKFITFEGVRPSAIDVYFQPEIEIRFNSEVGANPTVVKGDITRRLINVLPLPDPNLNVGGKTFVQGTWIPFNSALYAAWNIPTDVAPLPATGIPQISDAVIRQYWFIDALHRMYDGLGDWNPFQVWAQRVEAVKTHYRQTYQLPREWLDRMHSIRATRIGIVDPETGTRAAAQAFTDYCIRPNTRTILRSPIQQFLGVNVFGYAADLAQAKSAPAVVSIPDADVGIIRLDYVLSLFGLTSQLIPSAVDNLPTADIANLNNPLVWAGARVTSMPTASMPALAANHRVAVVISAAPAFPNSVGQMFKVRVTPQEAAPILGAPIGECNGPVWQMGVGPIITARFMWSDQHAHLIDAAFGTGGADIQRLEELLVNRDDVQNMAKAVAASVYSMFKDRWQGGMVTQMNDQIKPAGNLAEVNHTLTMGDQLLTTLSLPPERARMDALAMLPASTRRILFREVQQ